METPPLPRNTSQWELYEKAPHSSVKELNQSIRDVVSDKKVRENIRKSKKILGNSYLEITRSEVMNSLSIAVSEAYENHVIPVLKKHSDHGAMDTEPRAVAKELVRSRIVDKLGITDSFIRRSIGYEII